MYSLLIMTAKLIAHSITSDGSSIATFELHYPRWLLGEFNTHRLVSKNGSSSRAIPIEKAIEHVKHNTAMPLYWGQNQAGMQAKATTIKHPWLANVIWHTACFAACLASKWLSKIGLHKQWAGRLLEPFVMQKMVATSTDWTNFFWLRNHKDAQPEFRELAAEMQTLLQNSTPVRLQPGEWHTPYYGPGYWKPEHSLPSVDALSISASCCAQVSYRKNDDSLEKARIVAARLFESDRVHASPTEHQATPIDYSKSTSFFPDTWESGITHVTGGGTMCSGNLQNWIQWRQLIPNNAKNNFN